jgi:hypothetical protein
MIACASGWIKMLLMYDASCWRLTIGVGWARDHGLELA